MNYLIKFNKLILVIIILIISVIVINKCYIFYIQYKKNLYNKNEINIKDEFKINNLQSYNKKKGNAKSVSFKLEPDIVYFNEQGYLYKK